MKIYPCDEGREKNPMSVSKSMKAEMCTGPGGMNCPCCFPAPGSVSRRKKFKAAKKALKVKAIKEEMKFL